MKLTLLDIVQRTLSALDSNNVSSVDDSVESEQVVLIVQRIMDEINGRRDWKWLKKEGTLLAATDTNTASLPEDILSLKTVWYDNKELEYKYPQDFKYILSKRSTEEDNINNDGVYTDRVPKYYTSFDDDIITFDAYEDSGIIIAKTYIYYDAIPDTLWDDSDIPDIPARFHDVVLKGVLAKAKQELKTDPTWQIDYTDYKRGLARMLRWAKQIDENEDVTNKKVDYGRRGAGYYNSNRTGRL